jgi:hypothetical protein
MSEELREKLKLDIQATSAAALLPHHRRDALFMVRADVDILDAAVAIGSDEAAAVAALIEEAKLFKPSLAQLSNWCVDLELRFQFVILQPYVLAQALDKAQLPSDKSKN